MPKQVSVVSPCTSLVYIHSKQKKNVVGSGTLIVMTGRSMDCLREEELAMMAVLEGELGVDEVLELR